MESQINYDLETDVIVIGSGFAGLNAAIEAKIKGANVILFEKMKSIGGNSTISDGGIAAPETKLQEEYSIKDSKELMYKDIMESGLNKNDKDLVHVLVTKAKETFDWSIDYLNVSYLNRVDQFGGHSTARCYTPINVTGSTIIKKQFEKTKVLGIAIKKQMYFKKFILDNSKKVIGAIFKENYQYNNPQDSKDIYVKANKGVILCTGGFGGDIEFRTKYHSKLNNSIDTTNKASTTAEGIIESMNIGAETVDMDQIQLGPWTCPDERGYGVSSTFSEYIVFQYGMIVDPNTGKRFVNELSDRKILSDALLSIDHPSIGIADSYAVDYSGWNIDKALKRGVVITFDSIEELAKYYNIPKDAIQNTMKLFNENIINGQDIDYNKPIIKGAIPLIKAPFYAMRLWPKVHYTMGGLKINTNCEVINKDGNIIEGLFAAGEVTGGIHGANRLGSCAISDCLVFGRIAGSNAAK